MNTEVVETQSVVVYNSHIGYQKYDAVRMKRRWIVEQDKISQTDEYRRLRLTIDRSDEGSSSGKPIIGIIQIPREPAESAPRLFWLLLDLTKAGAQQYVGVAEDANDRIGKTYLFV